VCFFFFFGLLFCFLSPLVWFFLWLPEEVLALLFLLHRENGDFSILMKDIFDSKNLGEALRSLWTDNQFLASWVCTLDSLDCWVRCTGAIHSIENLHCKRTCISASSFM
jgi:hypothetical protein